MCIIYYLSIINDGQSDLAGVCLDGGAAAADPVQCHLVGQGVGVVGGSHIEQKIHGVFALRKDTQ